MLIPFACALFLGAHPDSHSSSRVVVDGSRAALELRCQCRSLIEALALDENGDGSLQQGELEKGRREVERYVLERYRLLGEVEGGSERELLEGRLVTLEILQQGDSRFAEPWARALFELEGPLPLAALSIEVDLFREGNPLHRDAATLVWNGEEPASFLFGEGRERWDFEPAARRRPGVLGAYARLGIEHILTGYDHIAFLLALLVASRRLRSLVGVVTAFTAAHSVTLALAALGLVRVPPGLVELAIALSIAYVATENLLFRRPGTRWAEAFGFGLVHGLGFAGFLADSLIYEPLKVTALVGFNLGVEAGQLAIVTVLALALRAMPGDRRVPGEAQPGWLAPRWARITASGAVALLGLFWFGRRAGWL
jgi:hydrogenase/urease accessory protein HupE